MSDIENSTITLIIIVVIIILCICYSGFYDTYNNTYNNCRLSHFTNNDDIGSIFTEIKNKLSSAIQQIDSTREKVTAEGKNGNVISPSFIENMNNNLYSIRNNTNDVKTKLNIAQKKELNELISTLNTRMNILNIRIPSNAERLKNMNEIPFVNNKDDLQPISLEETKAMCQKYVNGSGQCIVKNDDSTSCYSTYNDKYISNIERVGNITCNQESDPQCISIQNYCYKAPLCKVVSSECPVGHDFKLRF